MSRPPRLARRLLAGRWLGFAPLGSGSSDAERDEVLGSLDELYLIRREARGRVRADLWYWRQLISFPAHQSRQPFTRWQIRYERKVGGMLSDGIKDVRYAARGLAANPGFTVVAVLALALGIGGLTPTFSLINAYLLRPLPFAEPDRLLHLWETAPQQGFYTSRVSYPDFRDWAERSESFVGMAAFNYSSETLTGGDQPARIQSGRVSANVLDVLGVAPELGRGFRAGEDRPGNTGVVILSHGYWERDFEADPNVLGSALEVNGEPHTIIGVMPEEFVFPLPTTEIWLPWALDEADRPRDARFLQVVGRLAPGVTPQEAQSEMDAIAAALQEEFPAANEGIGVNVVDLRSALNFAYDILQLMSVILVVAGGFVLLIACANVSGLLLARAFGRRREVAIRTALGASRVRLVRQFLIESLMLAALGAALGVAYAYWSVRIVANLIPADLYRVGEINVDTTTLLLTLGVTVITALALGLLPALRASSVELTGALKDGAATTSARRGPRLRRSLVVGQIAMALVLLTGTATMIGALDDMRRVDTGFDARDVLTMLVVLDTELYPQSEQVRDFHTRVSEEVAAVPGVIAAATVNYLPLNHELDMRPFAVPGIEASPEGELPMAITLYASGDYFRAMGIPVLTGRTFDSRDTTGSAPVAVINDVLAERYFAGASPLGADIDLEGTAVRIVGVAANSKQGDLAEIEEQVYLPMLQNARRYFRVVARTRGDAAAAAGAIREAVWRVDPDLPVTQVRSLEQVVDDFLLPQRMISGVLGGMSLGALLLAAVGIYGVIAFIVSQSTREMSIRIALGATRRTVMRQVIGTGMRMAAVGTVIGLVGAVVVTRLMAGLIALPAEQGSMLRSGGFDPIVFALVPVVLIALAALACFFPALRATRVDPIVAMRAE